MGRAFFADTFEEEKQRCIDRANGAKNADARKRELALSDLKYQLFLASQELRKDKEAALAAVSLSGDLLGSFDSAIGDDVEVVAVAARTSSKAIACSSLSGNKSFMLRVFEDPQRSSDASEMLKFASQDLQADRGIVLEAVKMDGTALEFASGHLQADREIVSEAVKSCSSNLRFADRQLRADKGIILEAVRKDGLALELASEELKSDKEVVLEAVLNRGAALRYASEELRSDKEVVLAAVQEFGNALEDASTELKVCKDVVFAAIKNTGYAIRFASEEIRSDKDAVLLAIRCGDGRMAQYVHGQAQSTIPWSTFSGVVHTAIAVPGQDAPTVSVEVIQINQEADEDQPSKFVATITMMSGNSFTIDLSDGPSSGRLDRPHPVLDDLAALIVQDLPEHAEVGPVKAVFLLISTRVDGESVLVTPWEGYRPLTDFVGAGLTV